LESKVNRNFKTFIIAFYGLISICIFSTVIILHNVINFSCKNAFLLPDIYLWITGMIIVVCISTFIFHHYAKIEIFLASKPDNLIIIFTMILFALQVYICYNAYFLTDWDVGTILHVSKKIALGSHITNYYHYYYSTYPNNILITWIFSIVMKLDRIFGIFDTDSGTMSILILQCVIASFVGYLIFKICIELTKSYTISWIAWLFYCIFIGTGPWLMIPYSDSMGLLFPVLILRIYQLQKNSNFFTLKWFLIGLISFIGYKIKPQTAIIFIGIILIEIVALFQKNNLKYKFVSFSKKIFSLLCSILIGLIIYSCVVLPTTHIKLDKNKAFGMTHFLMLGLNSERGAMYSEEDVKFSRSFATVSERKTGNIKILKERLSNLGPTGLAKHYIKKSLTNFADGTFAWGAEGRFYAELLPNKNHGISPFLKNIFYHNGKYFNYYITIKQIMWLLLLFCQCSILIVTKKSNKINSDLVVMCLSIIGLFIFEMLFEARARYLYTYIPVYILLGVIVWSNMIQYLNASSYTIKKLKKDGEI